MFVMQDGSTKIETNMKDVPIETALNLTGFGMHNLFMTFVCSLSIMGTIIEMFGISFLVHSSACDLQLTLEQRGILTGVPMIGVIITAYIWGYLTDVKGRRTMLLVSMFAGFVASFLSSFAPNLTSLTILKFISMSFASASFTASYTYLGEFLPAIYRDKILTLLTVANSLSETVIAIIAYMILNYLNFSYEIPIIGLLFKPWRLLIIVLSLPMAISSLCLIFLDETPKFLLNNDKEEEAIAVLHKMYKWNTGSHQYPVHSLEIKKSTGDGNKVPILKSLFQQCEPLFRKPLLKYTSIIYVSLFLVCFVSNAFSMWFPYIFDKFGKNLNNGDIRDGTFCEVFSYNSTAEIDHISEKCDERIDALSFIGVAAYGIGGGVFSMIIAFLLKILGKKIATLYILLLASLCSFILYFVPNALASLIIFILSNYSYIIIGIMPIFIVDIYPTDLRGMAGCLSVMVARLGSSLGGYLTGIIFEPYCDITLFAASGVLFFCAVLALMLPGKK